MGWVRTLWKTRRREALAGVAVLLLLIVSLAVNSGGISRKTSRLIRGTRNPRLELLKKQEQLKTSFGELERLRIPIQQLTASREQFWQPKDGNPQQELRRRLEHCAKESGLRVKSVGTLQTVKVVEGLNCYEINLVADAQLRELLDFFLRIQQERPAIFWKNITVSPDNLKAPNYLTLTGTLKIVRLDAPDVARKLWGE